MIAVATCGLGQRVEDFFGCPYSGTVVAHNGEPEMVPVGDDHRAVREGHFVAGPTMLHVLDLKNLANSAALIEHSIANVDLTDGGPAARCRDRRIKRKRLVQFPLRQQPGPEIGPAHQVQLVQVAPDFRAHPATGQGAPALLAAWLQLRWMSENRPTR